MEDPEKRTRFSFLRTLLGPAWSDPDRHTWSEAWSTMQNKKPLFCHYEVARRIQPGSTVLDVGCGIGRFMSLVTDQCSPRKILGLDSSQTALDIAHSHGHEALLYDIVNTDLPLCDGQRWDYVVIVEVLEHIRRPLSLLKNALRVSDKVIITIPNSGKLVDRLRMLRGRFLRQGAEHVNYWTVGDYRWYLKSHGLWQQTEEFAVISKEKRGKWLTQLYPSLLGHYILAVFNGCDPASLEEK